MTARRPSSVLVGVLLAAPLIALTAWVVHGALNQSHGPAVASGVAAGRTPVLSGFAAPDSDLPRDRLEDRVDGAAEYLRQHGCERLAYWRLTEPPADLEILAFAAPDGAAQVLARDAGPERTAGPGDEAQVADQAIYFRRGRDLVRLFADPSVPADPAALARRAAEADDALVLGRGLGPMASAGTL